MPFVGDEDAPPGGGTVVVALAILVGIVEMCAGFVLIILSGSVHGYSTASAIVFGIVTLLVGAIYASVGSELLKLDPSAWMVGSFISRFRASFRAIYDLVWLLVLGIDGTSRPERATAVLRAVAWAT